jgi:Ulp1 family protease
VQGLSYVYPEDGGIGSVEVTGNDLKTLEDTEFVNDTIMDYYSKFLFDRYKQAYEAGTTPVKMHFFTAFFYKKLTEKGQHTRREVGAFPLGMETACAGV